MTEEVVRTAAGDAQFLAEIVEFRRAAYLRCGRDPAHQDSWITDRYDADAVHFGLYEAGVLQATARMVLDGRWPIEDRYPLAVDKSRGAEWGRLCVRQRYVQRRRVLFVLLTEVCRYAVSVDRPHVYGLLFAPLRRAFERDGIPLDVLSAGIKASGAESNVVHCDARQLLELSPTSCDRPACAG